MRTKNPHEGHRQRMKKKFLESGFRYFTENQIVEFMLFFSIPFMDTDVIAQRLLMKFGTIKGILEAPYKELITVNGVKENTAAHIKFINELCKMGGDIKVKKEVLADLSTEELQRKFCLHLFPGERKECVYALLLDDDGRLIKYERIGTGATHKVQVQMQRINSLVLNYDCGGVIICHNHPCNTTEPSYNDIDTTVAIMHLLDELGVELIDHIIVAKGTTFSLRHDYDKCEEIWHEISYHF